MTVKIHGKDYKTVAERINEFREKHGLEYSILTELVCDDKGFVIIKASVSSDKMIVATGYAEEERGSTNINKTSALENCETSAIGRALANFGFAGTEYASADEVANAIGQQNDKAIYERATTHMTAVMANINSVMAIKEFIAAGSLSEASEAWFELDKEAKTGLWVATTKGGCFTTKERDVIKSDEFKQAHTGG